MGPYVLGFICAKFVQFRDLGAVVKVIKLKTFKSASGNRWQHISFFIYLNFLEELFEIVLN